MPENTISIKLVDAGPVQSTRSGGPTITPSASVTNDPLTQRLVEATRESWRRGLEEQQRQKSGFFNQIGALGEESEKWKAANSRMIRGMFLIAGTVERTATVLADITRLATFRIQKSSEIAVHLIQNNVEKARIAQTEKSYGTAGEIAETGSMLGGAFAGGRIGMIGGPIGILAGTIIGGILGSMFGSSIKKSISAFGDYQTADEKAFIEKRDAIRDRSRYLSQYSPDLARSLAIGDISAQRRDMGEAQILGGRLSQVDMAQQQLDRLNQQLGILSKIQTANEQQKEINAKIEERQKELEKSLKNVDANTAAMIRKLGENAETPFEQLERRGGFNEVGRPAHVVAWAEQDLAKRMAAAHLAIPLLAE